MREESRIVGISGFTVRPPRARKEKPKVSAVTPLLKGMEKPTPSTTPFIFDDEHMNLYDDLPEWLRKKIDEQVKEPAFHEGAGGGGFVDDLNDEVPFISNNFAFENMRRRVI